MSQQPINDGLHAPEWFALRVKSGAEKTVAAIVHNKGFEEFAPVYRARRRWSDRFKWLELPLFPGYIFCRLVPERRLPILTTPGVMHFVGVGNTPTAIDEAEIAAIQSAVRSGLSLEPWAFLDIGQRVRVEDGPLTGMEGILIEFRKQHRIVVSVSLLRRSVAVEIDREWVRAVDRVQPSYLTLARQCAPPRC